MIINLFFYKTLLY